MIKYVCFVSIFISFLSCSKNKLDESRYLETNNKNSVESGYNEDIQENISQENNVIQDTVDFMEGLDEEQKEFFISIKEIVGTMHDDADSDDWESWNDKNSKIIESLLAFLKISTTWSVDITKYLPFIKVSISDDNIIKIYSWTLEMWGTGDSFNNIIQYKTKSGMVNAVKIEGPPQYIVGRILKDNVYLLLGSARAGGGIEFCVFKALESLNDELAPYPVFNGNFELSFFASPHEYRTQINYYDLNFSEQPFSIKFITHEEKILEFIFYNSEFIGDYEKFDEIRH